MVTLYNGLGAVVSSTTTDQYGGYSFVVDAGVYSVGFSGLPSGGSFSQPGQGSIATDSNPDPSSGRREKLVGKNW